MNDTDNDVEIEELKATSLADIYGWIDDGKFKRAFPFILDIKSAADKGDAAAQHYLGVLLLSNQEMTEGERYLKLSVDQGYLPAMRACLRYRLSIGLGDVKKARMFFLKKLMESGDLYAQSWYAWFSLTDVHLEVTLEFVEDGRLLYASYNGRGSVNWDKYHNDCRRAFMLLYEAAEKGCPLSFYMLASIYQYGLICSISNDRNSNYAERYSHEHELLVRGANAGDFFCLMSLADLPNDDNKGNRWDYSRAVRLRFLEMARSKWRELRRSKNDYYVLFKCYSCLCYPKSIESSARGSIESEYWILYEILGTESLASWFLYKGDMKGEFAGIEPSALMPSGFTGIVDNSPLPEFLTTAYEKCVKEQSPEYQREQQERKRVQKEQEMAEMARKKKEMARQEARRRAKERFKKICKGTLLVCCGIPALFAAVTFPIWWWLEGFHTAALPNMLAQIKGIAGGLSDNLSLSLKISAGVLLALCVLKVVWRLVKNMGIVVIQTMALIVGGISCAMLYYHGHWGVGSWMAVTLLVEAKKSSRREETWRWIVFPFCLVLSCGLGLTGHWIVSSVLTLGAAMLVVEDI